MTQFLTNFFNAFGKIEPGIELPVTNTFEQNVITIADYYNNNTIATEGFFFDFTATPEYEKPVLDYLINNYGWTLEKTFFIRKIA